MPSSQQGDCPDLIVVASPEIFLPFRRGLNIKSIRKRVNKDRLASLELESRGPNAQEKPGKSSK